MPISQGYIGDQFNPSGAVQGYAGASAPPGWLICDGSAISRVLYSPLFAIIGTTYGAGDGSTTFNIPDLRSRVPVGLSVGDVNYFKTLGEKGGEEFHTLTTNEMPSHTHNIQDGNFGYAVSVPTVYSPGGGAAVSKATSSTATNSGFIYNTNTGGGAQHNNVQPYLTINYIIKA